MKPIKFNPLLKSTIWGGDKIIPFKHLTTNQENVGESWEISGVKDHESIIAEGEYAGTKLNDLLAKLKGKLVGEDNYKQFGNEFPLLVKFIEEARTVFTLFYTKVISNRRRDISEITLC